MAPTDAPAAAPLRVVVTRPQPEAGRWAAALGARGVAAAALPLIAIGPAPDPKALRDAACGLSACQAVMFVSAPAVAGFFAALPAAQRAAWAQGAVAARAWATGPGTAQALREAGLPPSAIDMPAADAAQLDSEALWSAVQPQAAPGARVLIVRGADAQGQMAGRDWLARQLEAAGVEVHQACAYTRSLPAWTAAERQLARTAQAGGAWWLFSSSEAVHNLAALQPGATWDAARAVATHPRIAQAVRAAGFGAVASCPPGLDGLVAFLQSTP